MNSLLNRLVLALVSSAVMILLIVLLIWVCCIMALCRNIQLTVATQINPAVQTPFLAITSTAASLHAPQLLDYFLNVTSCFAVFIFPLIIHYFGMLRAYTSLIVECDCLLCAIMII